MKPLYITITSFAQYHGKKPFKIGALITCQKEPENPVDSEAIRCFWLAFGTVGYVGNSPKTVAGGTHSAGYIYHTAPELFYVRVCFATDDFIICILEDNTPENLAALQNEQNDAIFA